MGPYPFHALLPSLLPCTGRTLAHRRPLCTGRGRCLHRYHRTGHPRRFIPGREAGAGARHLGSLGLCGTGTGTAHRRHPHDPCGMALPLSDRSDLRGDHLPHRISFPEEPGKEGPSHQRWRPLGHHPVYDRTHGAGPRLFPDSLSNRLGTDGEWPYSASSFPADRKLEPPSTPRHPPFYAEQTFYLLQPLRTHQLYRHLCHCLFPEPLSAKDSRPLTP